MNLSLEARKVKDLDAATRDWIVDLMERNLKEVIDMVSPNSEQIDHRWAIERFVFFDKNIFTVTEKYLLFQSECCWSASKQTDLLEGKRRELLGEGAWFLLARDADTKIPLAFSHFRLA